jgi:hypothetical protein
MNECWIAAATYNMMLFTDWVPDPEVRYSPYGWSFIVIMCCQVLSVLAFIAHFIGNILRLFFMKYWKIWKPKFDAWWADLMARFLEWWEKFKWWLFDQFISCVPREM